MLGGQEVVVSPSIGISVFPKDGEDYSSLVRAADIAMYQVKRPGRGEFRFYSQELNSKVFHRLFTENALRSAIGRDQLVMHYQPRVCGKSNKIMSVEALVRWEHPEKGMIFPNEFISIAEEIDLIDAIGEWVLRRACSQLQQWQEMELASFTVSVNLSPRQLGSGGRNIGIPHTK
jgi:predicted signal transduction protein with EAL and GGDEF domain